MPNQRTKNDVEAVAKKMGWVLNPNAKQVEGNLRIQNKNIEKYGHPYCPCKPDKIEKNICGEKGCQDAEEEIKAMGHCHCKLYWDPKRLNENAE